MVNIPALTLVLGPASLPSGTALAKPWGVEVTVSPQRARQLLAGIRLVNGTLSLIVPGVVSRRLGTDPRREPAAIYPLRLFGIRTVLLGSELLLLEGGQRRRATQLGVIIHATDTASAALAGVRGQLPRRAAIAATLISATNTALAVVALQE